MINGTKSFLDYDMSKAFSAFSFPGLQCLSRQSWLHSARTSKHSPKPTNSRSKACKLSARRQAELSPAKLLKAPPGVLQGSELRRRRRKRRWPRVPRIAKATFEKNLATAKELGDLVTKANTEAFDVLTKRFTESFEELREVAVIKAA